MDTARLLTAEEFAAREGEDDLETRWSELVGGKIVSLEPPAPEHGAIVLNFAKAIAKYLQQARDEKGYAAFETGLLVARNPDTVRRPPVSFFVTGERFAELDSRLTETRPALVLEIASTNDRRRAMRERVEATSPGASAACGWRTRTRDTSTSSPPAAHLANSPAANRCLARRSSRTSVLAWRNCLRCRSKKAAHRVHAQKVSTRPQCGFMADR